MYIRRVVYRSAVRSEAPLVSSAEFHRACWLRHKYRLTNELYARRSQLRVLVVSTTFRKLGLAMS
jgi:hypothetical protein